mgnify:CR=1 FL=1|jgi:hypothetical protein
MNERMKKFFVNLLWLALILFVIRCMISMPKTIYDVYGCIGEIISITVILACLYEKWLWKYNPLEKTPVLSKYYIGMIKSSNDNIERKANLQIKQTLFSIQIFLTTTESKSKSISSSIDDVFGEQQLTYCYINNPNAEVRQRSEIHYGTAMICIENPKVLKGQYFTDRKTTGDMVFNAVTEDYKGRLCKKRILHSLVRFHYEKENG